MKFRLNVLLFPALLVGAQLPLCVKATLITNTVSYADNVVIPDNDLNGVQDTQSFSAPFHSIVNVQVSLRIAGGYNGDYYAYLAHGTTGFAVLLNRTGVTASDPYGYADAGFDVTLADSAANGDIHNYQGVTSAFGGPLGGVWQPDGRNILPSLVDNATPRTAMLNTFNGLDPNGDWTIFLADTSPLGEGTLLRWSLQVSGPSSVPDSGWMGGDLVMAAVGLLLARLKLR